MGRIKELPTALINHIAAGEVIERPASVIKELVENAIDAGATSIEVSASADARTYLRVADNGCGMDESDLRKAFLNHATSKITQKDDLFSLSTLGFRGEALASIAAVAQISCSSRPKGEKQGLKAIPDQTGNVTIEKTACAEGTIFEIENLFYNVPARLKFLKQPKTELAHIEELIEGLALSHPEIRFKLQVQDHIILQTSGSGDLKLTLKELFKLNTEKEMLLFENSDSEFNFMASGLSSLPSIYRSSKKWIFPFVNGRLIRCHILTKAVESAYDSLMTPGKYPVCIINLEVPADQIDVNVHPTKREIRYAQPNTLYSFVRQSVASALNTLSPQNQVAQFQIPQRPYESRTFTQGIVPAINSSPSQHLSVASANNQPSNNEYQPNFNYASSKQAEQSLYQRLELASEQQLIVQKRTWRVIGQLARTYILIEQPEGLLIVDQHIASERVLFEQFSDIAEKTQPAIQNLLVPLVLSVSPALASQLEESKTQFEQLGFTFVIEDQSLKVTNAPNLYNPQTLKDTLERLIQHFEDTGELKLNTDDVIATMACHSAVRAGDLLNTIQMEKLVEQWFACTRPWTCPHGRPVSHLYTHKELMTLFDRPSLPIS